MTMIPPPIDPRVLAAEIEATVAEFNRLTHLASSIHVGVFAELHVQRMAAGAPRPILMVQIVGPSGD